LENDGKMRNDSISHRMLSAKKLGDGIYWKDGLKIEIILNQQKKMLVVSRSFENLSRLIL
jgi:hypothetical protein